MRKNEKRLILLLFLAVVLIAETFVMPVSFASVNDDFDCAESQEPVEILSDDCYGTELGGEDFRKWAQADPRWGTIEISTSGKTVAKIGCLVTSITKLIIKSKLRSSDTFNVATLVNWLNANGGFTQYGDLYWYKAAQMIDGFEYEGADYYIGATSSQATQDRIMNYVRQNKHVVLHVKNKQHFIAVDSAKSLLEGEVYIMDSLNNTAGNADVSLASRYPEIFRISLFSGGEPDTFVPPPVIENYIENCDAVSSSVSARIVGESAPFFTLPCMDSAGQGSTVSGSVQPGSIVNIDEELVNPAGERWYRLAVEGQPGYISRDSVEFAGFINDLEIASAAPPSGSLPLGKSFNLTDKIVSKHLITSVTGRIRDINGNVVFSVTTTPNVRGEYCIEKTQINDLLKFGQLASGHYAYEVYATVTAESSLTDKTEQFALAAVFPFSVGTAALDKYTVTFVDGVSGSIVCTQTAAAGFMPVLPAPVQHEGVEFLGWTNNKPVHSDTVCTSVYGKRGDVDGDGSVTVGDAVLALRFALGIDIADEVIAVTADFDNNGSITIDDAVLVIRASLGILK